MKREEKSNQKRRETRTVAPLPNPPRDLFSYEYRFGFLVGDLPKDMVPE
jgi:hypothetical protein